MKMSVRTLCEICNKVVRYTNDSQQVQEAIDNPSQFCEGHIAEPNEEATVAIMRILRAHKNPDNAFFVSKQSGELIGHAYIDRRNGSYFPSIPKGSYELGAGKSQARSYAILRDHLHEQYIAIAKEEMNYQ